MRYWKILTLIALILVYVIVTKLLNPRLEIESSVEIDASDERIWGIVSNFSAYPDWNSYITYIEGDLEPGSALHVETRTGHGNHATYRPTVKRVIEKRELCWQGQLLMPGIYDSEQSFVIRPLSENRARFTIRGSYSGLLVPVFRVLVRNHEILDYERMNEDLKVRVGS